MKLYRIPIEKVLYFEDITKQAYEGDIASVASLVVLGCIFLSAAFLRHSLLGAALFTITCMMIIRFASEIKREENCLLLHCQRGGKTMFEIIEVIARPRVTCQLQLCSQKAHGLNRWDE